LTVTNNTVLLTGTGTAWTNSGDLTMGFGRTRGVLTASNGATLFVGGRASLGAIGGANFNSVSVTDPGTSWTIGSDLYVGSGGSANLLAISNGGFVVSSNAFLGASLGASRQLRAGRCAGSVWSNRNLLSYRRRGSRQSTRGQQRRGVVRRQQQPGGRETWERLPIQSR